MEFSAFPYRDYIYTFSLQQKLYLNEMTRWEDQRAGGSFDQFKKEEIQYTEKLQVSKESGGNVFQIWASFDINNFVRMSYFEL